VKRIILASASPRRAALLAQIGLPFEIIVGGADEKDFIETGARPEAIATRLSEVKARSVCAIVSGDAVIIGADTVVEPPDGSGDALGKPEDPEDARRMLGRLANGWQYVRTGVTIINKIGADTEAESFCETTRVYLRFDNESEIDAYVATGEPMGKAGAYGVQGKAAAFIGGVDGDYSNVVGLPLCGLLRRLKKYGVNIADYWRK
jgi:septum formation protein